MDSAVQPVPRILSYDDKCYLSRFFVTKDKIGVGNLHGDHGGLFIVHGTSPLANLETTLSIKEFLTAQNTESNSRSNFMYWTRNNRRYVEDSVFSGGEHYTSLDAINELYRRGSVRGHGLVYMDEVQGGRDLSISSLLLRRQKITVFMSIVADSLEDALCKLNAILPDRNLDLLNFASMASNSNESSHMF